MTSIRHLAAAAVALAAILAPRVGAAQKITACVANKTGSIYRVGVTGVPADCTASTHTKETWNGAQGAVKLPFDTMFSYSGAPLRIRNTNASTTAAAASFQAGNGRGVMGQSTSGAGVYGLGGIGATSVGVHGVAGSTAGSAGVRAEAPAATGTALEIAKGGIKVTGAGVGTPTAAFKVAITNHESGVHTLTLNNPLINGDPDALLFVTMNRGAEFLRYAYYVVYDNGYWRIRYETDGNGGLYEDYSPPPFYFNVLIVKTK